MESQTKFKMIDYLEIRRIYKQQVEDGQVQGNSPRVETPDKQKHDWSYKTGAEKQYTSESKRPYGWLSKILKCKTWKQSSTKIQAFLLSQQLSSVQ